MEDRDDMREFLFDFQKAFDCILHRPFLKKFKEMGLNKKVVHFLTNSLTYRYYSIVVNDVTCDSTLV